MTAEMTQQDAEGLMNVGWSVRRTEPLLRVLHLWLAQSLEEHQRLNVYFGALAFLLQVPGASRYAWVGDGEARDRIGDLVSGAPPARVRHLLATCLERLGARALLAQLPGAAPPERRALPAEWQALLDRKARVPNGLLNVIAECLDELVVRPGLAQIDAQARLPCWQCWPVQPH